MPAACARVPVAQYLRVSTDHQSYSLETRATLLSGIQPPKRNRAGLRELLHDVMEGGAVYRAE